MHFRCTVVFLLTVAGPCFAGPLKNFTLNQTVHWLKDPISLVIHNAGGSVFLGPSTRDDPENAIAIASVPVYLSLAKGEEVAVLTVLEEAQGRLKISIEPTVHGEEPVTNVQVRVPKQLLKDVAVFTKGTVSVGAFTALPNHARVALVQTPYDVKFVDEFVAEGGVFIVSPESYGHRLPEPSALFPVQIYSKVADCPKALTIAGPALPDKLADRLRGLFGQF